MAEEIQMSDSEKKKEDWMNSKWRPMMGWMYMLVCMCDFIVFPVLWSLLHAVLHTTNMTQWNPLTLQGAGLFHIAMGAVLGIAAFGRTQEKLGGANNGGMSPAPSFGAPVAAPSFSAPASTPSFSAPSSASSFSAPAPRPMTAPSFSAPAASVGFSSTGKAMPAPQQDEPL